MSGNSTRLGVGLIERSRDAALAGGLITMFIAGVIMGSLVGRFAKAQRRPAVLFLVAILLFNAASSAAAGASEVAIMTLALAMGAENSVFEQGDDVHIGLTYITGALVKFGQRAAAALTGGDRFAWAPYILLWAGLVVGAVAGAAAHHWLGLASLWFAAIFATIFAMIARRI
jgi:uncharacterized membrane protein YoaK (UPF0700 family)